MHQPFVEIKQPCLETLDAGKPGEQGNYCKTCRITVMDFTDKTPEEIRLYFEQHAQEKVCGTYLREQVKTDDPLYNFISFLHRKKLKFLAVSISAVLLLTGCKTRKYHSNYTMGSRILDDKPTAIESLK